MRKIKVYIEGGATGHSADNDFRRGWKKFLMELHKLAREHGYQSLDPVRGQSRSETYKRFMNHYTTYPDDLAVLLVDAETPVSQGVQVWDVVARRKDDGWSRPVWATEQHLYLMVHFVETWLLTDQVALEKFFKRGFNASHLPTTNLEERSKHTVENALEMATRDCLKGRYHHGYAHEIIALVDPAKVRVLAHGNRFFDQLSRLIINHAANT